MAAPGSSSDEDEFVAGSLKPWLAPPPPPKLAPPAPTGGKKQAAAGAKGGAAGAAAAMDGGGEFGSRVSLIRLDQGDPARWPGWQASAAGIRSVAPYCPAAVSGAGSRPCCCSGAGSSPGSTSDTSGGSVVHTSDFLGYSLSQLGTGFLGVLINHAGLSGANTSGSTLTFDMLCSQLQLDRRVMSSGLLFLWAAKGQTSQAVRFMAKQGFKYVGEWPAAAASTALAAFCIYCSKSVDFFIAGSREPHVAHTGAQQQASGGERQACCCSKVGLRPGCFSHLEHELLPTLPRLPSCCQEASPLFRRSHLTLLMGRRGDERSEHLELRHQRSPDVIVSPASCQCPEAGGHAMCQMLVSGLTACT